MKNRGVVTRTVLLLVIGLVVALPIYWAFVVSFTPPAVVLFKKPLYPSPFTLKNYGALFSGEWGPGSGYSFLLPVRNSIIVAVGNTLLSVIVSILAAYALAMMQFRGRRALSTFVLFAYVFPPFIIMIALRYLITWLGINDTLYGLILLHCVITVPYCTWMLRAYFLSVPKDIEEAAMVDGCTRFQALIRVILPVTLPGVITAATFAFTLSWQDLILALITLDTDVNYTVPMALVNMIQGDFIQWGKLMAGAVVGALPPIFVYYLLQRHIVSGLTAGAVKG